MPDLSFKLSDGGMLIKKSAWNALTAAGVTTSEQLQRLTDYDLLSLPGVRMTTLQTVDAALAQHGLAPRTKVRIPQAKQAQGANPDAGVAHPQQDAVDVDADIVQLGLAELMRVQSIASALVPGAIPVSGEEFDMKQFVLYSFMLQQEVGEVVREFNYRPWRSARKIDAAHVSEEVADVLAFLGLWLLQICFISGLTPNDIADAYAAKTQVNVARATGQIAGFGGAGVE